MSVKPSPGVPVQGSSVPRRAALRRALREVVFVAVLFLAYKLGRILVEGHVGAALENAQSVWDFERLVHLPSEASLQASLLDHTFWVRVANSFYAYVHFPATAATLIWLYLKRPEIYLWFRRTLASVTALALVIHAVFPLAPPRMLTSAGMVDTGHLFGPSVYGSPSTDTLSNQYAAMPSLHVGWALAVAIALIAATRSRRRWLWLAHPVATLLVVVVTGNHYWLDAIAAVGLLALVLAVVTPLSRPAVAEQPEPVRPHPLPAPEPVLALTAPQIVVPWFANGLVAMAPSLVMAPIADLRPQPAPPKPGMLTPHASLPPRNVAAEQGPRASIPPQRAPERTPERTPRPGTSRVLHPRPAPQDSCIPHQRVDGEPITRPPASLAPANHGPTAPRSRNAPLR